MVTSCKTSKNSVLCNTVQTASACLRFDTRGYHPDSMPDVTLHKLLKSPLSPSWKQVPETIPYMVVQLCLVPKKHCDWTPSKGLFVCVCFTPCVPCQALPFRRRSPAVVAVGRPSAGRKVPACLARSMGCVGIC